MTIRQQRPAIIYALIALTLLMPFLLSCAGMHIEQTMNHRFVRIQDDLVFDLTGCSLTYTNEPLEITRKEGTENAFLTANCGSHYCDIIISRPLSAGTVFYSSDAFFSHLDAQLRQERSARQIVGPLEFVALPDGPPCFRRFAHYTRGSQCVMFRSGPGTRIYGEQIIPSKSVATYYINYGDRTITLQCIYSYDPGEYRKTRDEPAVWEREFQKIRPEHDRIINRIRLAPRGTASSGK
jgi:hypothetical protein